MKLLITALTLISFSANATDLSQARTCFSEVGTQISISLSMTAHETNPGSDEEAEAYKKLNEFNDYFEMFPIFETFCNEGAPNGEEEQCKIEGYIIETKKLAAMYDAWEIVESTESCSGI